MTLSLGIALQKDKTAPLEQQQFLQSLLLHHQEIKNNSTLPPLGLSSLTSNRKDKSPPRAFSRDSFASTITNYKNSQFSGRISLGSPL